MLLDKLKIPLLLFALLTNSCKKLVQIPPPVGTISTSQVFSTDAQATSAISGLYFNMINTYQGFASGQLSIYCGLSADELIPFNKNPGNSFQQFQQNNLQSIDFNIRYNIWSNAYSYIYTANAILEGLSKYSGVHDSVKNELIGEAEFCRAFCEFYLVNLFGDIPLVTTTNWQNDNLLHRSPISDIYNSVIADLLDAQKRLPTDYTVAKGQRIVPNKWAASALLARVYLYLDEWQKADDQATQVIEQTGLYQLEKDLNNVFLTNSNEAIWQLQQNNFGQTYNATPEAYQLVLDTPNSTVAPIVYINSNLLNTFESGDQRLLKWVDSSSYRGVSYYFPYKYKQGRIGASNGGPFIEYCMVLRLAEQYLIRAEARAQLNNLVGLNSAQSDIDTIRARSGLPSTTATTKPEVLAAIVQENRIEFFSEWGHRWLDLKRWDSANQVLSTSKGIIVSQNSLLYPIPLAEIQVNPNLSQNLGY